MENHHKEPLDVFDRSFEVVDLVKRWVDDEGLVNVIADRIYLRSAGTVAIPVRFGKVDAHFDCDGCNLTSLKNAPTHVTGNFDCSDNHLTSLKFGPTVVGGARYRCSHNMLTSFEGAPPTFSGRIVASYQNGSLRSLDGLPPAAEVIISYQPNLPLLKLLKQPHVEVREEHRSMDHEVSQILEKHAGKGRRGAIQAAREMLELGEELGLTDHNPFERNARW
jgi:hypothetical protein